MKIMAIFIERIVSYCAERAIDKPSMFFVYQPKMRDRLNEKKY